jgi:hypothetical protein
VAGTAIANVGIIALGVQIMRPFAIDASGIRNTGACRDARLDYRSERGTLESLLTTSRTNLLDADSAGKASADTRLRRGCTLPAVFVGREDASCEGLVVSSFSGWMRSA